MSSFYESWRKKEDVVIVFAGVFDPVHKGHISAAEAAMKTVGHTVVFLPERVPQHKHGTTAYIHRLNMLRIATAHDARFTVLDYPEDQQYIVPTFNWLRTLYPDRQFVWLMGADVVPYVASWPDSEKLSELGVQRILAVSRQEEPSQQKVHDIYVDRVRRRRHKHEHLSSRFIRDDIATRHTALPDGVFAYIRANELYSATSK